MKVWFTVRTSILFVGMCFIFSCNDNTDTTPEQVVFKYVNHLSKGEHASAQKLLTEESKKVFAELEQLGLLSQQPSITRGDIHCEVNDNRSFCTYCCDHKKSEANMSLTKDTEWQVVLDEVDQRKLETLENRLMESQENKLNKALEELTGED